MNFREIKELFDEKNITDEKYIIWTDFERINMTHFRTSAKHNVYAAYSMLLTSFFKFAVVSEHSLKDRNHLEKVHQSVETILAICSLRMKIVLKLKRNKLFITLS